MADEHVVVDRTTSTKYGIYVDDERLKIQTSVGTDDGEPIVEDDTDTGNYYKFFVDNARLSIETTVTVQDDLVSLDDAVSGNTYKLVVNSGRFGIESTSVTTRSIFRTVKSNRQYATAKWVRV